MFNQKLRRLLIRFRGKVEFDFTTPKDVVRAHALRDGAEDDDWLYVSFVDKEDNEQVAIRQLENMLRMPQAEFDRLNATVSS